MLSPSDDDGLQAQAIVDPIQNNVPLDHELVIGRDYDSIPGIADKVMVNGTISIY